MVLNVVSGLISTALLAAAAVVWRHRGRLRLIPLSVVGRGDVRVSCAALLRLRDDDQYVLVVSGSRPGFFGPLGGVFKFDEGATAALDRSGFRGQRLGDRRDRVRADLRGFVPARSLFGFLRWFESGSDRETATECLRRELVEELDGVAEVDADVGELRFTLLRVVVEGPRRVPGERYRQLRRLEVHDLAVDDEPAARFRRLLLDLARDPAVPSLLVATPDEVAAGWAAGHPLNSHSGYLILPRKSLPDLPPMP